MWTIISGNLPNGVILNSETGVISGTPTESGEFIFTVKVENKCGEDEKEMMLKVTGGCIEPEITSNDVKLIQHETVSLQLTFTGSSPVVWSIKTGVLPNDLTLNTTTGIISGIPKELGIFKITIKIENPCGEDEKEITIEVECVDPEIMSDTEISFVPGSPISEQLVAKGEPGIWSWLLYQTFPLPNWMERGTCFIYNDKLYIPCYDKVEIFNCITHFTDTIIQPNDMVRHTSYLDNGKLYSPDGLGNILEIFDCTTETTEVIILPNSMPRSTCFIDKGKLYMPQHYGGDKLEIFDCITKTTETIILPNSMSRRACFLYNNTLYMVEYWEGNRLEIFDCVTKETQTFTLPVSMSRRACFLHNGMFYMPEYAGTRLDIFNCAGVTYGLDLNETTGLISGTPETANDFYATVMFTNDCGSDNKYFNFKK